MPRSSDLPVTISDVRAATQRIRAFVHRTPVMTSTTLDSMTGAMVFFKCENFQKVGAFKFRGATNAVALLPDDARRRGVVTHSSGNHAQALALAASMQGISAKIVMPDMTPPAKLEATRGYGAEIVLVKAAERDRVADEIVEREGRVLVHPSNDPAVIAGQGTAALELIEEVGPLDALIAPIGGGGLMSGTAIAAKGLLDKVQVFGAEPAKADDAYRSVQIGAIQPSTYPETIAEGLRTGLGDNTFAIIRTHVDEIVLVEEMEIVDAMRTIWERMKLVIEPSSAVAVSPLLTGKVPVRGKRVGVILSGGNVDVTGLFEVLRERVG